MVTDSDEGHGDALWQPQELGDVIAERSLTLESAAGSRQVQLRLGRPVRRPEPVPEDPFWCPFQLVGLEPQLRCAAGLDALQALLLSLQHVRDLVADQAEREGGKAYWLTDDMDVVFDQHFIVRLLTQALDESLAALDALERSAAGRDDTNVEAAAKAAAEVLIKHGSGVRAIPPRTPKHERAVFERARMVYLQLRDKFESSEPWPPG